MSYAEQLNQFADIENLGGKAWEHAKACDLISGANIKDCSLHCFHYQQMFELLLKHLLETKTEFGAYPHTHKLDRLLIQLVKETGLTIDVDNYISHLIALTMCAEAYRYNFLLNCETYQYTVLSLNPLLDKLLAFFYGK